MRAANGIYIPHGQPIRYYMGMWWFPLIWTENGHVQRSITSVRAGREDRPV